MVHIRSIVPLTLLLAGCTSSETPIPEKYAPEKAAEVAMSTYDANSDGKIAGAELDKCPALKFALPRVDTSSPRDDAITPDEIAKRMQALEKQSKLMGTTVQVTSARGPVSGATVTLALEPFMGADLPIYTVTTDQAGAGTPGLLGSDEPVAGIPLGFYRVTIAAPGQAEVIRGCEVADDSPTSNRLIFSLQDEAPQGGGRYGGR
jgi:hypothetical protein